MNNFLAQTRFISAVLSAGMLAGSLSMSAANAATQEYLQVPGANGSSTAVGHKNWIDVNSFSWGVSAPMSNGFPMGKPVFQDFQWTQFIDSSTPAIFSDFATGKHINKITFDVTEPIRSKQQTFFEMTFLGNAHITSLSFSGSSGGGAPILNGSFNYSMVKIEYWPTNADGFLGSGISASYDLRTNQGSLGALAALYGAGLSGGVTSPVPEPGEWALMLSGIGLLGFIATRRSKAEKVVITNSETHDLWGKLV